MTKARDLANAADVLDDVSATELSYVNGVTSAIQTQLNAKQATVANVNDTEIGYLDGVTSAIQTQIDGKSSTSHNHDSTYVAKSLVDAKGDLLVGSANDTVSRLAVASTAGYVLTVDSAEATGLKWAATSSGGMTLINTGGTALTGTSVTISSIPTTYNKLFCVVRNMTVSTDNGNFRIRLNGDSTANRYRNIYSWGAADDQAFNEDYIVGQRGSDNTADDNLAFFEIVDYANTSTWKVVNVQSVSQNATTTANINQLQSFGYYNQLSAITSIEIYASSGSFNSGTAYLYGVK